MEGNPLYIVHGPENEHQGPFTVEQLAQLAHDGRLTHNSLVQEVGSDAPVEAQTLVGVFAPPSTAPPVISAWNNMPPVQSPGVAQAPPAQPSAMDWVAPVRCDVWALIAGYLGLFSLILIAGPFAIAAGVIALKRLKQHPERTGKGRAWFGIVMGTLGTIALIALVASR